MAIFADKVFRAFIFIGFMVAAFVCPSHIAAQNNSASGARVTKAAAKEVVFSAKDRAKAIEYLEANKRRFNETISKLSESQLDFRPGEGKWTIRQVAEHIIVAESRVRPLITEKVVKGSVPAAKESFRVNDQAVVMAVTNRSMKFNAPPVVQPKQRWKTRAELISNFAKERDQTIDFMRTTKVDLRSRFAVNPLMGVIDAYQWVIFLNAHSIRHLAQIEEIKAHEDFPGN